MLGFIQRYQKSIFAIVAVLISISFLFFGIVPKGASSIPDKVAYVTTSKEKIKQSKFEGVKTLLLTNNGEYSLYGPILGPHYFTENFFVSDLMKPGFLNLLYNKFSTELNKEIEEKYKQELAFQPYIHPNAAFLNAQTIWSIHAPNLQHSLETYKNSLDPKKQFEAKQNLFLAESKFSSLALWQMLSENERQFDWVPNDPNLNPQRLNLFGYHSLEDWFGEKLIQKASEFIFEVNAIAKQQGYRLTDQEAEQDLIQQNQINFSRIKALGVEDFQNSDDYFNAKLRHLGMNRVQLISLWKELLIFRRFFQESGNAAILDSLAFSKFEQVATEKIRANQYTLPPSLHSASFEDLMKMEVYLEALGKPLNQLSLNFKRKECEEVAASYPQLVETPYQLQYKEINLTSAALSIRVQDIWNWKLDPQNYSTLSERFPELKLAGEPNSELFQTHLENLDALTANRVDQFVREFLFKGNKEWLEKAFMMADSKIEEVCVRPNGQGLPFKGLELFDQKENFLSDLSNYERSNEQRGDNLPFTFDQHHYYQILALDKMGPMRLVALEKLKQEHQLDKMLHKKLNEYLGHETKFQRGLTSAQKKVALKLFNPLKEHIVAEFLTTHKESEQEFSEAFYCQYRFYHEMQAALNFMKENGKTGEKYSFNGLWTLEESSQTLVRYLAPQKVMEDLLPLSEGQWSAVNLYGEDLEFYHVFEKLQNNGRHVMQREYKNQIGVELKKARAQEILNQLQESHENFSL